MSGEFQATCTKASFLRSLAAMPEAINQRGGWYVIILGFLVIGK